MNLTTKNKIEFLLFILGIIGIILFKVFDNKTNRRISEHQSYCIGKLTDFNKSQAYVSWVPNSYQLSIRTPKVEYKYFIKNKAYKNYYGSDTFPINENLAVIGKEYFVIFNLKKTSESRILLEYIVNDSSEFNTISKSFRDNSKKFKTEYNVDK
jgi:hypothetical protein